MATTELERLIVRLTGDGAQYAKMLEAAGQQTKAFGDRVQKQLADVNSAFLGLTAAVAAPLAGVGAMSVKAFSDFDHAMIESTSIMKLTGDQAKRMRDVALDMGSKWSKSAEDMARSYFFLASAGLDAEQAIAALPAMERFAMAGAFDMARATSLAADAQSALGLKAADAQKNLVGLIRVTDTLVKANVLANANVEQFSIALTSQAGASLKAFNKDIEEGVAVLAALADQGVKAELAGNSLSRVMRLLGQSSRDQADIHKRLGLSIFDAGGEMRNFADIVENLEQILLPMSVEMRGATLAALGFEARIQQAVFPLLGTSKAIRRYEAELRAAGGTTADIATKQMKSLNNQLKRMANRVTIAAIEVGEVLAPALQMVVDLVGLAVGWFRAMDPAVKTAVVVTGALTAAFLGLAGTVILSLKVINVLTGGALILAGVIVTGVAAASAATAGLVVSMGGVGPVFDMIKKKALEAWAWLAPVRFALASFFSALRDVAGRALAAVRDFAVGVWKKIAERAGIDWNSVRDAVRDAIIFAEFTLGNFRRVAEFAWLSARLGFVVLVNEINHAMTTALPAALGWFKDNWKVLWKYLSEYGMAAHKSMISYVVASIKGIDWGSIWGRMRGSVKFQIESMKKVFAAMPRILSGAAAFDAIWGDPAKKAGEAAATIKAELSDLPKDVAFTGFKLPERVMGDLEKRLRKEWEDAKGALGSDFAKFRAAKLVELGIVATDPGVAKAAEDAKKAGGLIGEEMNKGMAAEVQKMDAVLSRSAEALARVNAYRERLAVGKPAAPAPAPFVPDVLPGPGMKPDPAAEKERERQTELQRQMLAALNLLARRGGLDLRAAGL